LNNYDIVEDCNNIPGPINDGYDPRCRPWWNEAYNQKQGYTFIGEPYLSEDLTVLYVSLV